MVGGVVDVQTPQRRKLTLQVIGIYRASRFDPLFGGVVVSHATFDGAFERPSNVLTLVRASGGPCEGGRRPDGRDHGLPGRGAEGA